VARTAWVAFGVASLLGLAAPSAFATQPCPPDSPSKMQLTIGLLDAPLASGDRVGLERRIAALNDPILYCPGPNPVPALFRTFLRSRYGGDTGSRDRWSPLPEDPDLFERALKVLAALPAEQVASGAASGLGSGLRSLTWRRLLHDWLRPAAQSLAPTDQRWFEDWEPPAIRSDTATALVHLVEQDPRSALFALSTGGGSLTQQVAAPLQDELFAALLQDCADQPARQRMLLGVIADSGLGGSAVVESLNTIQTTDADTRAAVDRARASIRIPDASSKPGLPATPPGRIPGLEARSSADLQPAAFVMRPPPSRVASAASLRTLTGGLVLTLALWVGTRRRRLQPLTGPVFGVGLLLSVDGMVDLAGWAPPVSDHPLFQFISQSSVELQPSSDGYLVGGGSMRLQRISVQPDPDRPRVVFLGASSVHGSHYVSEDTFPARVSAHGPPIEAINFGIGGTTSVGVAAAGRVALGLKPDALVVMYGHNEAAQFARLALYQHTRPAALQRRFWLSRSGLYRLLSAQLHAPPSPGPQAGMYRTDEPSREEVRHLTRLAVQHLRLQLGGLLQAAHATNVPVLLVLPPTNLRFAHLQPFDTPGPGDAADLDGLRQAAEDAARAGRAEEARARLQQAIDRSASPREVVTSVREALIELGQIHGIPVVDAAAWMYALAPDGVTPSGLFWDDIHPTAEGHDALASLLAPAIEDLLADHP